MKKIVVYTLLLLLSFPIYASTRGIGISIRDRSGKQIGMYAESHALLIGVSDYTAGWPDLETIPEELIKVEWILKKLGFNVVKVINPDSRALERSFRDFIDKYGYNENDRLLFFFSGHGYSRKNGKKGYLVPSDAPNPEKNRKGFLRKALNMSQIITWSRQIESKHALFLFDSCFSGAIFKTKALPKTPPHINAFTSRPVRQYITAGSAGEEVPASSVFTPSFVRALEGEADLNGDGYVTGTEMGMFLNEKVMGYNSQQTPQYGKIKDPDLDRGDFVFVSPNAPVKPKKTASPREFNSSINAENELWGIIKDSEYIEDFQEYLSTYPTGRFSIHAKTKIRQLKRKQRQMAGGTVQTEEVGDGGLNISSQPSGVKIYVDNHYKGTSPISVQLKPGRYTIKGVKSGFKPEKKTVQIRSNKRLHLSLILDKLGGSIWIRSNPKSAKIYLNNAYYGKTPDTLKGLSNNIYRVTLKKDGYQDWQEKIRVSAGQESQVNATLRRQQPIWKGKTQALNDEIEPVSAHGKKYTLRFASQLPASSWGIRKAFKPWKDAIEKAANGRIKIKEYHSQTLAKGPDTWKAVKSGIADIGWCFHAYWPGMTSLADVISLPLLPFKTSEEASAVLWMLYERFPRIQKQFSGNHILLLHTTDPYFLVTTRKPVRTLEDFRGMKIRMMGGPSTAMLKRLGGVPVAVPMSGNYIAMQRGIIDGVGIPWEALKSYKLYEVVKYYTLNTSFPVVYFSLAMNKRKWNLLPSNLQKVIIRQSGLNGSRFWGRNFFDSAKEAAISEAKQKGYTMNLYTLPEDERERWLQAAGKPIWNEWVSKMRKSGHPEAEKILNTLLEMF